MSLSKPQLMLDVLTAKQVIRVYTDRWTGAIRDISVFQADLPAVPEDSYIIGQVAVPKTGTEYVPSSSIILVRPLMDDLVKTPIGYTLIWDDKKSGGKEDVSVWRVQAPEGYVALGDVFYEGYDRPPETFTKKFACLREDLLIQGQLPETSLWDDRRSGARKDVSIWQVEDQDARGLAGFFIGHPDYGTKPQRKVYALPAYVAKE